MPFPSFFKDADETSLLANVKAFFAHKTTPQAVSIPTPPPPLPLEEIIVRVTAALIQDYDFVPFSDPQQVRNYVTNNLLAMSSEAKGETARLKALEMLGKLKDVGLFDERSTILVEHMTTDEIKQALTAKVQRLRMKAVDAEVVDITQTKRN